MNVILDKSVLVGASQKILHQFAKKHHFVFTPMLRYEIASGTEKTFRRCKSQLRNLTGYWLPDLDVLLDWEIEKGQSAKDADVFWNRPQLLDDGFFEINRKEVDDYENGWIEPGEFKVPPEDANAVKNIRKMQKAAFYRFLENEQAALPFAKTARESYSSEGKKRGLSISRKFRPKPNWLCYGFKVASHLSLYTKVWRYSNDPADPKKPANFGLDLAYVAFLSIADGFLSADIRQLDLAWACWPEKRSGIFFYDDKKRIIRPHSL